MTPIQNHINAKINLNGLRHEHKFMTNSDSEIKEYNKGRLIKLEKQAILLARKLSKP
jgi:serine kinase of HPr protein (carbohydrate metabolism regulator)